LGCQGSSNHRQDTESDPPHGHLGAGWLGGSLAERRDAHQHGDAHEKPDRAAQSSSAERLIPEARVAELEGIELHIKASGEQVERLKATWSQWSELLGASAAPLPEGTYGSELGRSILRKVLSGPIVVTPEYEDDDALLRACAGDGAAEVPVVKSWHFRGTSRFDYCISGGLSKGEVVVEPNMGLLCEELGLRSIAGGSGVPGGRDIEGPPSPPRAWKRPGVAVALLDILRFVLGPR
jgi:hypothetical protein